MKNLYYLKLVCFIYLFIFSKPLFAQEHKIPIEEKTQKVTTIWNGTGWSNGLPNLETKAIFAADFISSTDLSANEMELLPDVDVIISNTHTLTVVNDVKSAGTSKISFDATAQFIQKNPTALTPPFEIFRETTPIFRKDYTYFSSPVSGQALNTITAYSLPFDAAFDVGDYNNTNGLPFTGDYNPPLFDKYYQWNASATPVGYDVPVYTTGAWQPIPETTTMSVARGYIVRGPQSFPDFGQGAAQPWWVRFSGVVNNGNISTPIVGSSYTPLIGGQTALPSPVTYPYETCNNNKYQLNLIGNPYPSALDADSFLTNPSNVANLDGAIYLWSHNSMLSPANPGNNSEVYNYTANGYVIYNLIGGVGTGRHLNDVISAPTGTNRPIGKIASCQGFFVRGINNGNATFTNEMRDNSIATENQQFYRGTGTGMIPTVPKNRFWLSLQNVDGTYQKELLIGYMPQRTVPAEGSYAGYTIPASLNSYDKMYDTELIKTMYNEAIEVNNRLEFYSMINAANACPRLTIQGRNSQFLLNDVIPLGFSCPPGNYTINAQTSEGIFPVTQRYWLREDVGGGFVFWDIINTPFEFSTTVAIADNTTRFQIVFTLPAEGTVGLACNSTLPNLNTLFNAVGGASNSGMGYRWMFTDADGNQAVNPSTNLLVPIITTGGQNFSFTNTNIPLGFIDFGMTYFIRVGIFNASQGIWVYSANPCSVSTPPRVITAGGNACGSNILIEQQIFASPNPPFGYAWRINNGVQTLTFDTTTSSWLFRTTSGGPLVLQQNPGFITGVPGTIYCIEVAILYATTPERIQGNFVQCCFTTNAPRPINHENDTFTFSDFTVKAFPNPFETDFSIAMDTESPSPIKIDVYDMIGKMMESKVVPFDEISTFKFGNDYSTGIYNVIVTQGNIRKNVKLIKR